MSEPEWSPEGAIYASGLLNGRKQGRIATLRLVYIGAACAEVLYEAAARYDYECWGPWTSVCATALATLNGLASLGDETAIGLLAEAS